jgi:hypothetical protein
VSNIAQLKIPDKPEPPKRCEFPNCPTKDETVGFAKLFQRHFCPPHRKVMLLAKSYIDQVADRKKSDDQALDMMGRLQLLNTKKERVFVLDKGMMDDLKELISDQAERIKVLENDRAATASAKKEPETPST